MIGTTSIVTEPRLGPWAGGSRRSFERGDVVALGKLRRRADTRIAYLVALRDGAELFVVGTEQPPDDLRWLRRIARSVPGPRTSRDVAFVIEWSAVL